MNGRNLWYMLSVGLGTPVFPLILAANETPSFHYVLAGLYAFFAVGFWIIHSADAKRQA